MTTIHSKDLILISVNILSREACDAVNVVVRVTITKNASNVGAVPYIQQKF
jgi:hypothetical protein